MIQGVAAQAASASAWALAQQGLSSAQARRAQARRARPGGQLDTPSQAARLRPWPRCTQLADPLPTHAPACPGSTLTYTPHFWEVPKEGACAPMMGASGCSPCASSSAALMLGVRRGSKGSGVCSASSCKAQGW